VNDDFILQHVEWVFKLDKDHGLECLKKFSHKDPFKSAKVFEFLKQYGPKTCLKYLEYLALDCGVKDVPIHTELACLYVDFIKLYLKSYRIFPNSQSMVIQ
jgi:hypothetical protein